MTGINIFINEHALQKSVKPMEIFVVQWELRHYIVLPRFYWVESPLFGLYCTIRTMNSDANELQMD